MLTPCNSPDKKTPGNTLRAIRLALETFDERLMKETKRKLFFGIILSYDGTTLCHTVVYRRWKRNLVKKLATIARTGEFYRGIYRETETDIYTRQTSKIPTPDPNRLAALVSKHFRPHTRDWTRSGVPSHWN